MIPLIRPLVPNIGRAVDLFQKSIATGQLTNFGPLTLELERRLNAITGGNVVTTISGTAALELALRSIAYRKIKRVLVPDFTHSGTVLAVIRAGMVPVLAGVDEDNWTVSPKLIAELARAKAIDAAIIVSPFGYDVDVPSYERESAILENFPLVYDFAGAFGHFPKTKHPVCYSFHATKNLGACEAGAVRFGIKTEAETARRLSNFDTLPNRNIASLDGANQKIDEWRAALLLAALELEDMSLFWARLEAKRATLSLYLASFESLNVPDGEHFPSLCVLGGIKDPWHFQEKMAEAAITVRPYYPLLSRMLACVDLKRYQPSSDAMARMVALPSDVTIEEAWHVIGAVQEYLWKSNR